MRNCFEGYLTENCAGCPFWKDGSDGSIGCSYPGLIDHCEAFAKAMKEEWRLNEQNREFKDLGNPYGHGAKIFLERKGDQELNDWSLFK